MHVGFIINSGGSANEVWVRKKKLEDWLIRPSDLWKYTRRLFGVIANREGEDGIEE